MDKFLVVFKREYLERVRSKWFVIVTLSVPVLWTAMILVPAFLASRTKASEESRNIAVIDASGVGLGDEVVAQLMRRDTTKAADSSVKSPTVQTITMAQLAAAESASLKRAQSKPAQIIGYLVLTDSTLSAGRARYSGRNASSIGDLDRIENAVEKAVTIIRLRRENVRPEIITQMTRSSVRVDAERITDQGRGGSGRTAIILGYMIALLLYMSIILHGQNILRGVLEEKTTRVAEVVLSSVKPDTLLYGKVLGVGMVGLTQQLAWFGMTAYLVSFFGPILMRDVGSAQATVASGAANPMSSAFAGISPMLGVAVLLFFLGGFFFYGALFAGFGAMVNSEQEAQQAVMPVMMMLIATIVMLSPVMIAPNGALATTLSWLPFSAPIIMPTRMSLSPIPMSSVIGSIAVTYAGAAAAIWFAARIYRVGMLMYGKKPGFKEIIKWARTAT